MSDEYYDEVASSKQEVVAQTHDMADQRRKVIEQLSLKTGESVLDVGSGNGILAREMLDKVGDSGTVVGIDPAESMISMSRGLCPGVSFLRGDASSLPVESAVFDAVTASQVLCFVLDVEAALAEMHRVLRTSGRLVILDTDWDTLLWNCSDKELLSDVVADLTNPYTSAHVPRTLSRQLKSAGFDLIERHAYPIVNWELSDESYSGLLASFLTSREDGQQNGVDLKSAWKAELAEMAAKGEYAFSLNRYIFSARKR